VGLWLLVFACGVGRHDASAPDGGTDAAPLEPPRPPEAPSLEPCPQGWTPVADPSVADLVVCDPWPDGKGECARDEARFPGTGACSRIGSACGIGDYADGLPASGVFYVDSGAPPGGDGSLASPFARIADAIDVASPGDTIALSADRFDEAVDVGAAVTIRGACVSRTIVASSRRGPAIEMGGGALVEDVQVWSADAGIHVLAGGASLDGVLVLAAVQVGVVVDAGATLDAADLVVKGTAGTGLYHNDGSHVRLDRAVFEDGVSGIHTVGTGAELVANDLAITGSTAPGSPNEGYALEVNIAAHAVIERAVFEDNQDVAIFVDWDAATLDATDLVIRDTRPRGSDDFLGYAVQVTSTGVAHLERALLERNRSSGIHVREDGSSLSLVDVVIRDTQARAADGTIGYGIDVGDGATADLTRVALVRNRGAGLSLYGGADVTATDLSILETRSEDAGGTQGDGLALDSGARIEAVRALLSGNRRLGAAAFQDTTQATFTDVVVEGTAPSACEACEDRGGTGLAAYGGARLSATRFRTSDNDLCGLQMATGGEIDLATGEVSRNAIGVNLQIDGFDLARIQDGVVWRDNDVALDSTTLPSPSPVGLVEP
jgi:hypothetical protein